MSFISICVIFGIILYYSRKRDSFLKIPNETESDSNKPSDLLSFLVVGDWGANPAIQSIANQTLIANAMLTIHDKYSTQFVISVGDHFYDHGILTSQSKRWIAGFEDIYYSTLKPWYIIFGNHDFRGSVKAQIEYSKISKDNRWVAPSPFYIKDFEIPHTTHSNKFRIIFLDTNNLMCNHEQYDELGKLELYECDEMFYKLPEKFLDAHSEDPTLTMEKVKEIQKYNFDTTRDEQLNWFRNEVIKADKNKEIKFVFIVAHHALFSQGPHGVPSIFNQHVQPILRLSNKIIAWFCGHNHALEHYIWDRQKHSDDNIQHNELHQFLSGSGGRDLHDMKDASVESQVDDVKLGFLGKEYGFVSVHLQKKGINVAYWNEFSKLVYSYAVEYPK